MKTYDTFLFYNELDLLELRLNILQGVVDKFVLVEAKKTFSGKNKPLYFQLNKERFSRFKDKIIHHVVDNDYRDVEPSLGNYYTNNKHVIPHKHKGIPLCKLHQSVQREVFQRDSIIIPLLADAKLGDMIMLSDVDEMPNPEAVRSVSQSFDLEKIYHFCQRWYIYWLNNFCDREWFGTRAFSLDRLMKFSVDQMRYHTEDRSVLEGEIIERGGWHFSYLGGAENIKLKLDSLAHQGKREAITKFLNKVLPGRLERLVSKNKDILLQGKKMIVVDLDHSFPAYILENLEIYKSFIKNDSH